MGTIMFGKDRNRIIGITVLFPLIAIK